MNISHTILSAIIENTSDLVYIKDLSSRYLLVNLAFAQAVGSTIDAIVGKSTGDFFAQEVAERIMAEDRRILAGGQAQTVEESYQVRLGERVFQTVKSPYRDESGQLAGIIGIARDVTEQRRQVELEKLRADAEKVLWAEVALKSSLQEVRALAAKLESVREEERTHIARELHDGLGQSLTALKFDLAWLAGRLAPMDAALRDKAQSITAQIDTTIRTVRRLSAELRPGMLDDFGLAASIEWHAQEFQERTGVQCDVSDLKPEPELTRAQATALFRIFQETMTNVARHANATRVVIRLRTESDALVLQVQDNGRGMTPNTRSGAHSLGLVGMRERAELLAGTLHIASTPGSGTTVTVSIPLAQTPAANGVYTEPDVNL